MTDIIRYSRIYVEDLDRGYDAKEVTLADGNVVSLRQVNLDDISGVYATNGTVERNLSTWFSDIYNVRAWMDTTVDGTTSNQTGLAAAVAKAYADGKELYWPAGTYVSTATIPNFHDVRHRGPGIVKRGSDLFYVDPSLNSGVTNTLYVATTGSNAADGLSSTYPRLTTLSAGNVIYTYLYGNVTWVISHAAGSYSVNGAKFDKPFPSPNRIQFNGASVSRGVQPTTIFTATTPGTDTYGLYFQNNIRSQVKDINFRSYRAAASPSANSLSTGIISDGRCELYTDNVWTDDCDQGIYLTNGSQARIQAGRHGFNFINGNGIQFIRHSHGSVGYGGTLADVTGATGTAFIGGSYGVMIQEFSMAHTDTCYFDTQTLSGVICNTSRVHAVDSVFKDCTAGIDARMCSNIGNTTNTFTGCTTDLVLRSGSRHAGTAFIEALGQGPPIKWIDAVGASTQSATPVTVYTRDFEAKELQLRGSGFELKLYGEVVGTAATKTITITLGATTLLTATIAAATTDYEIQVKLMVVTCASSQKVFTRVLQSGVLGVRTLTVSTAEDLTAAKTLTVTHQVTNVADTNRVGLIELEVIH